MKKITLEQWTTGTIAERAEWLDSGTELDATSHSLISWALFFKEHGATISDQTLVDCYRARMRNLSMLSAPTPD